MICTTVNDSKAKGMDIVSRHLMERNVFIEGEITSVSAQRTILELLYLDAENAGKDINLYIQSTGGNVQAALAIIDTMELIKSKVNTICVGLCASAASIILAAGDKRFALKNSEIMIHQPSTGIQGNASDIEIVANHILDCKRKIYKMLAEYTGKSVKQITKDSDRDHWMNAEEAMQYGIVDEILKGTKRKVPEPSEKVPD